jgi:hypothetical protein
MCPCQMLWGASVLSFFPDTKLPLWFHTDYQVMTHSEQSSPY